MRVDIGGGTRLFFDVVGSGLEPTPEAMAPKPTLLLLHGGPGGDHAASRPYFDRFADTHQVVYLDHRGNGRSDERRDPSGWNLATWADDVVRFCDALEITAPHVVGGSFGGFVGMKYAARHPEHPGKLVLMSTAARRLPKITAERFAHLGGPEAAEIYRRVYDSDEPRTPELWDEYGRTCLPLYNVTKRRRELGSRREWRNLRVLEHFNAEFESMDLRPDLSSITCPTLVLSGFDDPMTPREAAQEIFASLRPGIGRLELLDDCGHGTQRDQPERTEAILRAFLAS